LVANARKMDPSLLSVAQISWWNPATQKWEAVSWLQRERVEFDGLAPHALPDVPGSGNGKAGRVRTLEA
jgi:hypothetical protein